LAKYDSIVIGGEFFGIGAAGVTTNRALRRIAYYDWSNGNGNTITLLNQPPPITFQQVIGAQDLTAQFTIPSAADYNITASQMSYSTSNPTAYAASFGIYLYNGNTQTSSLISSLTPFTLDGDTTPNKTFTTGFLSLTPQTLPSYYWVGCNTGGPSIAPLDVYTGLQNNVTNTRCCVITAIQAGPPVGWRAFQDTNWATPEGPDSDVFGGAMTSNGTFGFAYGGVTITASTQVTANYAFSLSYTSGSSGIYNAINSDANAIDVGQAWDSNNYQRNCVTGGNPVLAFGAGNAVVYGELYFNTGNFNAGGTAGVNYRPTAQDPYEPTDSLVLTDTFSISANQLKPQFSSQPCYSVYRDDTKYPDVFFLARGNELSTATLPFTGGVPNYSTITFNSQPIACYTFGGYSDEVGYVGALFVTNTNLYVYKSTSSGELVIDLTGCVVRTFNDVTPSVPIVATNKLTFPTNTDGGSVLLCGDTSTSPVSWWAISQDGPLYYDNTLIGGSGGGVVDSVTGSGAGISVSPTAGAVVINNTGVTSIVAGANVTISSTLGGGTGAVTINAAAAAATSAPFAYYKQISFSPTTNTINYGGFSASAELTNGGLSAPVSSLWDAAVASALGLSSSVVCEITCELVFDGSSVGGQIFSPQQPLVANLNDNGNTNGAIAICYVPSYRVNGGNLLYFTNFQYSMGESVLIELPNTIAAIRGVASWTAYQTSVKLLGLLDVAGLQPADSIVFYLNAYTQYSTQTIDTTAPLATTKVLGGMTLRVTMTK
jgi:hypothetical protein